MTLKVQPVRSLLECEEVLERYDIPLEGEGWIKKPKQLYGQIRDGESVLAVNDDTKELIQFTWRSQAQVYRLTPAGIRQRLVECKRIVNGRTMEPKKVVSVSEKIWALKGEVALNAMIRCFLEELGIVVTEGDLRFLRQYVSDLSQSSSFPLRSQSCIFLYECHLPFLRTKNSYTEKREKKVTKWGWEDAV